MNYCCPLCAADLQRNRPRKTPPPGGSTAPVSRYRLACPVCGGALMLNPHSAEKAFFPGILFALIGLNIYSWVSGVKVSMPGALWMLAIVFLASYAVRNLIPPKNWPRYAVWRPSKR